MAPLFRFFRVFSLQLICALCPKGKLALKEEMSLLCHLWEAKSLLDGDDQKAGESNGRPRVRDMGILSIGVSFVMAATSADSSPLTRGCGLLPAYFSRSWIDFDTWELHNKALTREYLRGSPIHCRNQLSIKQQEVKNSMAPISCSTIVVSIVFEFWIFNRD